MLKIEEEIRKIAYLNCEKSGHEQEPLSRICIEEKCQHKTLVCALCEDLYHKDHETVPLKTYLIKTYCTNNNGQQNKNKKKKIGSQTDANPLYLINQIDQIRHTFFTAVAEYRNQILDMLGTLEANAQMFFNKINQETRYLLNLQNPIAFMKNEKMSQRKLKDYFRHMTKTVNYKQQEVFTLGAKLEQIVTSCRQKQKKLQQILNKSSSALQKQVEKISMTLNENLLFSMKNPIFEWSEKFKGHKVKISGAVAEQTGMESSGQRFAMLEPSLGLFGGGRKITWGFRVIKFVGWVGIGICLKNQISKANYHFNYGNIGHGSYLISTNGYSWSHSVKQFNSAFKSFQFAVNDTVYIQYDPGNKKLRFKKKTTNQSFELDIVDPPGDDEYYPCANICSNGDTVEVINQAIQF